MRKGSDGHSVIVRERFGADPADGSLFVLVNRARNRMKMLHFEGKGFWLYYRVLEAGMFEELPDTGSAVVRLDATQLWMLLNGVSLVAAQKRRKRYMHPAAGASTSS
ncbi:MAG: transposase [Pirellulaceae bacterium]|nr:MAG: transposase [Pirellulaceae bacterium]GIW95287.1 MAG: transposase [Pirellulaceae bacterium]